MSMTDNDPIVVSEPTKNLNSGATEAGVAVRKDPTHGICIDNYSDGEAWETVYVDKEDVPDLVHALMKISLEEDIV